MTHLQTIFGEDFLSFFYTPKINQKIRILEGLEEPGWYQGVFDNDYWQEKNPFNFPGPLYTGVSDNCGTGHPQAPFNILYDRDGREYVYRQPTSYAELDGILTAAAIDPFGGYASNGNYHWTYESCKDWWHNRENLIAALHDTELQLANEGREKAYIDYLRSVAAETDLRRYCYFLEHQRYPANEFITLPDL